MTMQGSTEEALSLVQELSKLEESNPEFEDVADNLFYSLMYSPEEQQQNEHFREALRSVECLKLLFIPEGYGTAKLLAQIEDNLHKCIYGTSAK